MSLRIRMARGGAKKRPFYRIVVADSRSPRDGRFIEKIGFHNPMAPRDHDERLRIDVERARHWLSVGASPSPRVHRFLASVGVMDAPAIPVQTKKSQPKAKAQERLREAEEAKKARADAAAEAAEAPAESQATDEAPEGGADAADATDVADTKAE